MTVDELSEAEKILRRAIRAISCEDHEPKPSRAVIRETIGELEALRRRFEVAWAGAVRREASGETRVSPGCDPHSAA
jgi:hypothetical protein